MNQITDIIFVKKSMDSESLYNIRAKGILNASEQ
mgnify:CR=1 FL=1